MTQVAGLQTVDAEGNVIGTLSVDDLTNLVANNLVKSTQNQIAAARSVSTMSEASTLAASYDYENTFPIDAIPASVRTLDSEGNPKQTGISAFAQVVGGLQGFNNDIKNVITVINNYNQDKLYQIFNITSTYRPYSAHFLLYDSLGRLVLDTTIIAVKTSSSIIVQTLNKDNISSSQVKFYYDDNNVYMRLLFGDLYCKVIYSSDKAINSSASIESLIEVNFS